jgi:signal transduction histidine kinase/ligand-binding sensor domain-containing protein
MKIVYHKTCTPLVIIPFIVFLASCHTKTETPFPENPSGFIEPKTQPFEFPEFKPFKWNELGKDSMPTVTKIKFNLENYPSSHFSTYPFKPLKSPITKTPINWENPEEIQINLDTIKNIDVPYVKYILAEPEITNLGTLTKSDGTTSGIIRIGQSEGLIGNAIYSIYDDQKGSIWFSSEKGVHRFTGDQFENYSFILRNLDGNIDPVVDIGETSSGKIMMVANASGLYLVDPILKLVEHFKIGNSYTRGIEDDNGNFWFGNTAQGIVLLDPKERQMKYMNTLNQKLGIFSAGVFMDSQKNIWMGYGGSLVILNPQKNVFRILGQKEGMLLNSIVYEFLEDREGTIWLSSFDEKNAFGISLKEKTLYQIGAEHGFYTGAKAFNIDSKNRLWITDNDTITIIDREKNLLKKIPTGADFRSSGLPSGSITDSNGNIWIGTTSKGVLLINPTGMLSQHFDKTSGLASNDTWGIGEDYKGRIWLAEYDGINVYDPNLERLYLVKFPENLSFNDQRSISILKNNKILVGGVRGFIIIDPELEEAELFKFDQTVARIFWKGLETADGNIWLGSLDGLFKYNPTEKSFSYIDEYSGLASNRVWLVEEDKKGNIWLGNDLGINILNKEKDKVSYLGKFDGLTSDYVSMITQTDDGEILAGSDNGFSIINLDSMSITNVLPENGMLPPVMYDMITMKDDILIGSENGIVIVNRPTTRNPDQKWRFSRFSKPEGFPFNDYNQATAILTSSGTMWWAAAPILSVINQNAELDTLSPEIFISNVKVMDQSPQFVNSTFIKNQLNEGDTIWNSEQTAFFEKSSFPSDSSEVDYSQIQWDSLDLANQLPIGMTVPYDLNSFNFSFINPSIQGRDKIVYRYILEGADENWSEPSAANNSKNYYNLVPGEYEFKVATSGFNGVWSEPASFKFTILPPWWQTWGAYLLFAALFAALVYVIVYVRSQLLKKENRILEEKVNHRTKQLKEKIDELKNTQTQLIQSEKMASLGELTAGIAHEIQNPLNFVNNFSEVNTELLDELKEEIETGNMEEVNALVKDIIENEEKINFHGKRADAIVKGMLQHSRSSNGQKAPSDLNALADEYLRLSYHGLRAKDKSFNATLETDFDENMPMIEVVSQDVGRVILNLITNAFHAVADKKKTLNGTEFNPTVKVSTKNFDDHVEIIISDNGNGIPESVRQKIFQPFFTTKPTGQGTGLGLSLSYDIMRSHGGEIQVDSESGSGAKFKLILPKN